MEELAPWYGDERERMKRISCKKLKFIYIQTMFFVFYCYYFFFGEISLFEETGNNYFHIILNGQEIGVAGEEKLAEELLVEARRNLVSGESELVFMENKLECIGEEVLWGAIDSRDVLLERMQEVLEKARVETVQRAYTVKVNEYTVNLRSISEVEALLQAAVDRYDTERKFQVELLQNLDREFSVLSADIVNRQQEQKEEPEIFPQAGIHSGISNAIAQAEPEIEKDFEDYELGILEMSFLEEVEIVEAYLPESRLTNLETAIEEVTKDQELITTYEVVAGDTLTAISLKVNIPMEQIIAMNSSILEHENSVIHIGDELVITVPEPELSVRRVEENYVEEVYDADVIYIDNDDWYTTKSVIHQQPSAGFRKVIAITTYENNKEVGREIIKEEVVMEAVPKIVERGTKIPPTYIKPISGGRLTSRFGKRKAPVAGASTYHKGVDWAVPTGTAVFASSGGTVAKAGWGSGYGYVVYINHPDGRQTRYAHCSKVLVSAGQTVKQGQKIALSGNTGVSSGPHVHFEMLINGVQKDALQYLD